MKRSEAREQAFILIFERSFKDEDIDEIIEQAQISRSMVVNGYAHSLAQDVSDNLPWLDKIIAAYSKKWKIQRISRVSLSILRLSLWEIDHVDTVPEGVSINEAVELAKKYGNADDFSFVNGVLGAYVRAKEHGNTENIDAEKTQEQTVTAEKEENYDGEFAEQEPSLSLSVEEL